MPATSTAARVRVVAATVAGAALLAACGSTAPPPVRLSIDRAGYDCGSRVLVVEGGSVPATAGLEVQVQVRTGPDRRGVVWQRATSGPDGRWRAKGRDLAVARAVADGSATVVLRAGSVTEGVRVFSPRTTLPVRCPGPGPGPAPTPP